MKLRTVGLVGIMCATAVSAAEKKPALLGADHALSQIEAASAAPRATAPAAAVLSEVAAYRVDAPKLEPAQAVAKWIDLFDRVSVAAKTIKQGSLDGWDPATGAYIGPATMFAALPPPEAWPELRKVLDRRAKSNPRDRDALVLRLVGEILARDAKSAEATLAAIDSTGSGLEPDARSALRRSTAALRGELASLYGSREDLVASIVARSREKGDEWGFATLAVPDLVGLVGEARAREILTDAVRGNARLAISSGDSTRALARAIALDNVASMKTPQWTLVTSPEDVKLFEALDAQFRAPASSGSGFDPSRMDFHRSQAEQVYFVGLVMAGRHDEAATTLERLTRDSELSLPKTALDSLMAHDGNAALYAFLGALLAKQPDARVWDVYLEQAAFTGNADEALVLIDGMLAKPGIPAYVATNLRDKRIAGLLAADRVDDAIREARALLSSPPNAKDELLDDRAATALRLAGIGRVLGRPDVADAGVAFVRQSLLLEGDGLGADRDTLVVGLLGELRRGGRPDLAEALALAELRRRIAAKAEFANSALQQDPGKRRALVELAGIYHEAGRHPDVVALLDRASGFGVRDVADILAEKDTLGRPLGVIAATALAKTGNSPKALAVLRATLDVLPGNDAAYELFVELAGPDAIAELDRRYLSDRFEERPLVWKAVALTAAGRYEDAEETVKSAIAIDPSDGEQGRDDRMRAYATLAAILEARGEKDPAAIYRRAVQAIRLSEQGDELHALGLYERAFARYRAALEQFSDAYCVQSRLAVQLSKQGMQSEALAHYRRAYELMPDSFGRVESHCFGCESVFAGPVAQGIAEEVFVAIVAKRPEKAQGHYMLGYLRREQGRYAEAIQHFRDAVSRDDDYLNAWRHLHEIAELAYVDPAERDIARLKLLELDAGQRHVRYALDRVSDLGALYRALGAAQARKAIAAREVYALQGSTEAIEREAAKLGDAGVAQLRRWNDLAREMQASRLTPTPSQALGRHVLIRGAASLLTDAQPEHEYLD